MFLAFSDTTDALNVRTEAQIRVQEEARLRDRSGTSTNGTTTGAEVRQRTEAQVQTRQENRQEAVEQNQERRQAMIQVRMENRLRLVIARFEATIDRLENIIARVETRISKIKSAGGNTVEAEAKITEAKNHLVNAENAIIAFRNQVNTSIQNQTETNLGTEITKMLELSAEVKMHLRESHGSIVDAVVSLKGTSTTTQNTN